MCNSVMRQTPAGGMALRSGLQPVELLRSHKRGKKGFTRTQPVPFGKCFLHSLKSYKVCILYSFLCLARDKITKQKMAELHSQIGTFSDLFDKVFHTAQSRLKAPIKICCLLHRKKNKIFCFYRRKLLFPCQNHQQCEYFYSVLYF